MERMSRSPVLPILLLISLLPSLSARAEDNVAAGLEEPSPAIRVAAVGDIMMGTTFPESILPPEDGATLFRAVAPLLAGHDVVFGNLEGPVAAAGKRYLDKIFHFLMDPPQAKALRAAGFRVEIGRAHV